MIPIDLTGITSVTIYRQNSAKHTPSNFDLYENHLHVLATILADPTKHTLGSIGKHIKTI